ncbi:response regulator [Cytobacillus oceanisediminis]|uniref:response regulator transcription factor n=1 Tax=Cytobacillus oceanisediminis TaxID=665099 RepID=UPI0023D9DB6B|nr:response regulator [Cytobacillus oceanisediminis]MDF2039991.1 response regulator [Cytobacillus oceanisediminis]
MNTKIILIVDDEETTRQGLKKTLEGWSAGRFEIISAADGHEALELFKRTKVNLLITDICMPEMNGLALLKHIRNQGYKPAVMIISGYPHFEFAQEAIRLGVLNYLVKPLRKESLIKAIEEALETEEHMVRADYLEKVADQGLLELEAKKEYVNSSVKQAIAYVNENLPEQISLKEVADAVHLNASYFSAMFKEQTSITFSEYLTRKRLQLAKKLLITTDLPIDEVARQAGYQTAKYFIKLFKDSEGVTPSKYRKLTELDETPI